MCHWFWVSLAHVTNYCSGKTGCQVTAGEGVALASSDHAAFKVEIGRTYSFLLDARTSDTLKTCTITGADVDPIVERDTALDPWTLTAFKVEAKLTATEDIIRISGQGRGQQFLKGRAGLCYSSGSVPPISVPALFGLPVSRILSQSWRDNLITPLWILPCLLLVGVYNKQVSKPLVLFLQASLLSDVLFWAGHTGANAEMVAFTLSDHMVSGFLFVFTAVIGSYVEFWSTSRIASAIVGILGFIFGSFYWTPLLCFVNVLM